MAKGVYHSELEQVTGNGSVSIVLKKSPANSRNKDLAGFCTIIDWEGNERYLNIENQQIRAQLDAAPLNVPLQVRAGGMREDAWLQINGQQGEPVPPQSGYTNPAAAERVHERPAAAVPGAAARAREQPGADPDHARALRVLEGGRPRVVEAAR